MFHSLTLPRYETIAHLEGKGNYALRKYYAWPYRFFYRHKLRMILNMMDRPIYQNILDFGSGPGVFTLELQKRGISVKSFDSDEPIDFRWKFDLIVCASVLEFTSLYYTLTSIKQLMSKTSTLIVASPMDTKFSRLYFKAIKDGNHRNSHTEIVSQVSKYFKIERYKKWFGLYFVLRAKIL